MASNGEMVSSFWQTNAVPVVQSMYVTNGHQPAVPDGDLNAPAGNPNTGNYPNTAIGNAAHGYPNAPNGFSANAVVQTPLAVPQGTYAAPIEACTAAQVQQGYASYGNPTPMGINGVHAANPNMGVGFLSGGAPPVNNVIPNGNTMVDSSGVMVTNNYGPHVPPTQVAQAQPLAENNYVPCWDLNSWNSGAQQANQSGSSWPQNNWSSGVQNTDQTFATWSQTNKLQEYQSFLPPSGVDQATLQLEWEAYQALLNQDKGVIKSDNQGPKDAGFPEGFRTTSCGSFVSTSGYANGENSHYPHQVSGGINHWGSSGPINLVRGRNGPSNIPGSQPNGFVPSGSVSGYKTRLCMRYTSPEGCKYGDKCNFAHGEADLRVASTYSNVQHGAQITQVVKLPGTPSTSQPVNATAIYHGEPSPPGVTATVTIGATSLSKLAIDAAYVGAVIGKAGSNIKQINKATGCKVSIREHESNLQLRSVEMEGSPEQIDKATEMVKQLLQQKDAGAARSNMADIHNYKTRLCENFNAGACSYGDRCHFAHGVHDLRSAMR